MDLSKDEMKERVSKLPGVYGRKRFSRDWCPHYIISLNGTLK